MSHHLWERRRYWHHGRVARIEWWRGSHPAVEGPEAAHGPVRERDFCYTHGTPIYPNLGCQICSQRPGKPAQSAHRV